MPPENKYILDANVFIEAKNRYYAFDIAPGFWNAVIAHHAGSRVFSIDHIKNEINGHADELSTWATTSAPPTFFESTAYDGCQAAYKALMTWAVADTRFTPAARNEFASVADAWIAAHASQSGLIVVTHELSRPDSRKRVMLPDACQHLGVRYTNPFDMLRSLGVVLN